MNSRALIGAVGGAILGALIWGGITYATGLEVGYVALGIGILVGGAARYMGANDRATGAVCAVLALAAIFVGKMLAVELSAPTEIRKFADNLVKPEHYDEAKEDAEDFSKLTSEDQYASFITTHDFRDTDATGPVTPDEITSFKEHNIPKLKRFKEQNPSYEEWRKQEIEEFVSLAKRDLPLFEAVVDNLNVIDIIFALLGVTTAFKLASGSSEE